MASKGKKILIGCGVTILVTLGLFTASCIGFVAWLRAPGELIDPELLLAEDSTGYVRWVLHDEDPATARFARKLIELTNVQPNQLGDEMPGAVRNLLAWSASRNNEKKIRKLFPMAVAWTMRPGPAPNDELHLFTLNPQSAGHQLSFADWILGFSMGRSPDVVQHDYQGERIWWIEMPKDFGVAAFIRQSSLFVAFDVETAKRAVDGMRLQGRTGSSRLKGMFAELPTDRALRGAISNRSGELARILPWILTGEGGSDGTLDGSSAIAAIEAVTLEGGFVEDGMLTATVEFRGDPNASRWMVDLLRTRAAEWSSRIQVRWEPNPLGGRALLAVDDPAALLDELVSGL